MTTRSYTISAWTAPSETKPPEDTMTGGYSVGAHDAAKNYAGLYLPGYSVISCQFQKVQDTEKHGLHSLWKAELLNQEKQLGAVLYVREL